MKKKGGAAECEREKLNMHTVSNYESSSSSAIINKADDSGRRSGKQNVLDQ